MTMVRWPCGCELPIAGTESKDDVINVDFDSELPLNIKLDIYNINLKCEATWNMFAGGQTKGIFQLESQLGRKWSKALKPNSIEDLGALGALLRPGCLRAMSQLENETKPKSMTERYCDRKHGLEDVVYVHPILQPILQKTQGVLVFQEQAMKLAVSIAGFNEQEADILRKAIGKKKPEIMASVKKNFLDKAEKTGIVSVPIAEEIFGWIQESQRYSFNKSHADAYGKNGYWSAFCKTHFKIQFYCSWLRGAVWKTKQYDEVYELVNDAKVSGIDVGVPNIADKKAIFYIKNNRPYFGLSSIRGIGEAVVKRAVNGLTKAEDEFGDEIKNWDWLDFLVFGSHCVPSNAMESLIKAGALDIFKQSRNKMLYEYDIWSKLKDNTEKHWIRTYYKQSHTPLFDETFSGRRWDTLQQALTDCQVPRKIKSGVQIGGGGCATKRRSALIQDLITSLDKPPHSLLDTPDWIAWVEQQSLGASITCSKVDGAEGAIDANCTCKEFIDGRSDYMKFAVEIVRLKQVKTKRGKDPGQDMAFLTIEDNSCSLDNAVCFPKTWSECKDAIYEGNVVLIHGERDNDSLVVQRVWQI